MRAWCDIAELTNTKHLNGGLVVRCTAGLPFLLEEGMEVRLVPPVLDAPRCVTVADAQSHSIDGGVVWFEEVKDAATAKLLVGCHCLVSRSIVEELTKRVRIDNEEFDISGWEAYDEDQGFLGTVVEIREMPGQMMLIIDRCTCEPLMVPMVNEFITAIDEEGQKLHLSVPAGILTL